MMDYDIPNIIEQSEYVFVGNTQIAKGAGIDVTEAKINNYSVNITNNGYIKAEKISIANGLQANLYNNGDVTGGFYLGNSTKLTYIINSEAGINNINIKEKGDGAKYVLQVNSTENMLPLSSVLSVGAMADTIKLNSARLLLNSEVGTVSTEISLSGTSTFYIDNAACLVDSGLKFTNLDGAGWIIVEQLHPDSMYVVESHMQSGSFYISVTRNTDYETILDDTTSEILDSLRENDTTTSLFDLLDNAATFEDLNAILDRSVHFNFMRLMKPVKTLDNFQTFGDIYVDNKTEGTVSPFYIYNTDFSMFGFNARASFKLSDAFNFSIAPYFARLNYASSIDEFDAYTIGGKLGLNYDDGDFVARLRGGASKTYFSVGAILYNDGVVHNPDGISTYGALDIGYRFNVGSYLNIMPFVGASADYVSLLNKKDIIKNPYIGAEIATPISGDTILYDYALRLVGGAEVIDVSLRASVWFDFDDVGADVSVGYLRDDMGNSYYAKIAGKIKF